MRSGEGQKKTPRYSLYLQMDWRGPIAEKVCYGDAASLMGEVTFTQQQQHLSWSLSFVHASSYPEGHDKRVSRSISKPPMSVREEGKLLGCNMEYNSDFSANKRIDTDDQGKPGPLLTLDMVDWPQDEKSGVLSSPCLGRLSVRLQASISRGRYYEIIA